MNGYLLVSIRTLILYGIYDINEWFRKRKGEDGNVGTRFKGRKAIH